jgi:hypothetical protein
MSWRTSGGTGCWPPHPPQSPAAPKAAPERYRLAEPSKQFWQQLLGPHEHRREECGRRFFRCIPSCRMDVHGCVSGSRRKHRTLAMWSV